MLGSPTILDIISSPDILIILHTYLTAHDLTQCILVSHAFAQIFTPRLWHTISLKHDYQETRFITKPTGWHMHKAIVKNAQYIHIIRVRSVTCLEPFITVSGIMMKNLHTLEFPWTTTPLVVSRGLALTGQTEGLWSLFELQGQSVDVEKETERRLEEEGRMARDAERKAKHIAPDDNATLSSTTISASVTQDWIRYRAMYPMRREQIMQDFVSMRGNKAYEQAWRRYLQYRQQQQETILPGTAPDVKEEEDEEMMDMEEKRRQSRIKLQEVADEIAAFNKQHPLPPVHKHVAMLTNEAQQQQRDLQEKFSTRLLQLEVDEGTAEAAAQKDKEKGKKKEGSQKRNIDQLRAVLYGLGLGLRPTLSRFCRPEPTTVHRSTVNRIKMTLKDFFQRYPTIRTFRDYGNHSESEGLWGAFMAEDLFPSYLSSTRHLSWSTIHGASSRGNGYRRRLEGFVRSPYLNLESLRLSLLYPSGMDVTVSRPMEWLYLHHHDALIPIRNYLPTYLNVNKENAIAVIDDRTKMMQRAGPISSLTQLFIEDCMCPGTLMWSKDYVIPAWVPFLQRCPNLHSLALGSCPPPIWFEIARLLQAHCPWLEDLAIAYGRQFNTQHLDKCDAALSALLFACSHPHMDDTFGQDDETIAEEPIEPAMGLKRLRLDALVLPLKSHALRMLLDYHSGSLTDLGIMDCKNLQKNFNRSTLLKILRSFGQLEQVHLLPSGELDYVEEDHIFDAHALIDSIRTPTQYTSATSTWACAASLKVLRIMIGGLANNNSNNSSSSAMDTTANGELDLQRQIYRFLGSLTNLEELCLGFGPEEDSIFTLPQDQGRQKDCLDFSLESGLELMEGLRSLRLLNVARMNHRIRLCELQWMCRSWPQLRMIEGLLKAKSLERWQEQVSADGDDDADVAAEWGEALLEDRKLEEEVIVCWLQTHRPQLRYT
ncbi:hypothetical protein BG015_007659 [Linnemannia schmuckeri]|uniref:F-box domain-containing protein n=1 Tax=Linnemannia schmuckeri TaxID=64567 RepID=A0A9P5RY69_9FUNG|nr:hypothetical protein BG015_007659 [Linnemannia schmuckeri]